MPLLSELGTAVRERRTEIGLSQQQLAELAGLSRATVNHLEAGHLHELGANRAERLANALGFSIGLVGTRRPAGKSALEAAARVASVPYKNELPPHLLLESLTDGIVAPGFIPHLRTLLEEAPVALLADLAEELARQKAIARSDTWRRMRLLAAVLKCERPLWKSAQT